MMPGTVKKTRVRRAGAALLACAVLLLFLSCAALPVLAAQEEAAATAAATATAAPESTRGSIPWTAVILVSSVISFAVATALAIRKANKKFGKGFD